MSSGGEGVGSDGWKGRGRCVAGMVGGVGFCPAVKEGTRTGKEDRGCARHGQRSAEWKYSQA